MFRIELEIPLNYLIDKLNFRRINYLLKKN